MSLSLSHCLFLSISLALLYWMRVGENKMKTFDAAARLADAKVYFPFFSFAELPHIFTSFAPSVLYSIPSLMALLVPQLSNYMTISITSSNILNACSKSTICHLVGLDCSPLWLGLDKSSGAYNLWLQRVPGPLERVCRLSQINATGDKNTHLGSI